MGRLPELYRSHIYLPVLTNSLMWNSVNVLILKIGSGLAPD